MGRDYDGKLKNRLSNRARTVIPGQSGLRAGMWEGFEKNGKQTEKQKTSRQRDVRVRQKKRGRAKHEKVVKVHQTTEIDTIRLWGQVKG